MNVKVERITPQKIEYLNENEIFVFGSNLAGKHEKGAAKLAYQKFGAQYGVGEGLMGNCYALPTKDTNIQSLTLDQIYEKILAFTTFAQSHPELFFYITKIGCGLGGYKYSEIAPLFKNSNIEYITNIALPIEFWQLLNSNT